MARSSELVCHSCRGHLRRNRYEPALPCGAVSVVDVPESIDLRCGDERETSANQCMDLGSNRWWEWLADDWYFDGGAVTHQASTSMHHSRRANRLLPCSKVTDQTWLARSNCAMMISLQPSDLRALTSRFTNSGIVIAMPCRTERSEHVRSMWWGLLISVFCSFRRGGVV